MNCIREGCCGTFTALLEGQNPVLCDCWNFFMKFFPALIQFHAKDERLSSTSCRFTKNYFMFQVNQFTTKY